MTDITPENVARLVEALRRASGRFDILDCETALQVADLAEALSAQLAEVEKNLVGVCQREAASTVRWEAKLDAAEAENAKLRAAGQKLCDAIKQGHDWTSQYDEMLAAIQREAP